MDHTYYLVVIFGYVLVAVISFCAGWIWKTVRTKRVVKEIDGFALYKVAMQKAKDSAKIKARQEREARRRQLFRVFKG